MSKLELSPCEALYPVPVVMVSCTDHNAGRANIITIAWCGIVASNPPLISISIRPSRYSHGLIMNERNFVINIPSRKILRETDYCGIVSGRDTDKFKACNFTPMPSTKISSPIIQECAVNIECIVKDVLKLGSHDMFIGEVVALRADRDIVDSHGAIDQNKTKPIVFSRGEYWDLDKKIGYYGYSSK